MTDRLRERDLSVYEWALVNGGPRLAVRAALASLLSRGAIRRTLNGYEATRSASPRARSRGALESEIVSGAAANPRVQVLIFRVSHGRAVTRLVRDLVHDGYLRGLGHHPTPLGLAALQERRILADAELRRPPFDPGVYVACFGVDKLPQLDPDLALQLGLSIASTDWETPGFNI